MMLLSGRVFSLPSVDFLRNLSTWKLNIAAALWLIIESVVCVYLAGYVVTNALEQSMASFRASHSVGSASAGVIKYKHMPEDHDAQQRLMDLSKAFDI
jgi:hypothetical protein